MPRRQTSPEEAARDTISKEIPQVVDRVAASWGPAADADPVSDARMLRQWGQRDPKIADAEGLRQQLLTTGLPMKIMDPESPASLAFFQANKDIAAEWAEILSSPLDERMADLVTPLLEYPLTLGILRPYEDDPEEMVRVSNRLDGQWQREMTKQAEAPVAVTLQMIGG